jgi:hypothetical protein
MISLANVHPNSESFSDFELRQIVDRTIQETENHDSANTCNAECATSCLSVKNLPFNQQEVLLSTICNCQIALYYQPSTATQNLNIERRLLNLEQ